MDFFLTTWLFSVTFLPASSREISHFECLRFKGDPWLSDQQILIGSWHGKTWVYVKQAAGPAVDGKQFIIQIPCNDPVDFHQTSITIKRQNVSDGGKILILPLTLNSGMERRYSRV
ncbi:hypothetical protein PoB_001623400 [Plakobranchus ocellatus]|uniref:Uncharacterized protein n=1 Tax=Plakobranchus ocellatus TaxID=259542 RepID=A0AAV3Z359_9GAST|nr:hypothetical protein PoB_001623400 [Plakobranchus ocellatus]